MDPHARRRLDAVACDDIELASLGEPGSKHLQQGVATLALEIAADEEQPKWSTVVCLRVRARPGLPVAEVQAWMQDVDALRRNPLPPQRAGCPVRHRCEQ